MTKIITIVGWLLTTSLTFNATWYGEEFNDQVTFSGEKFNCNKLTCASNYFPIGTKLKITNKENKKSVIVKCNDRGGMGEYTIDLSKEAFKRIADLKTGVIEIKVKVIK
jgi:rare lipoprotein A